MMWQRATEKEVLTLNWGLSLTIREAIFADYKEIAGYGRDKDKFFKNDEIVDKIVNKSLKTKLLRNLKLSK